MTIEGTSETIGETRRTSGKLDVANFRVVQAPALARLFNAASVSGFADLLQGNGIAFDHLDADFNWADGVLTLREGRAAGSATGITFAGPIDLGRGSMDINGTLVPVYTLNRIVGAIPFVGDLLSGGEGHGPVRRDLFDARFDRRTANQRQSAVSAGAGLHPQPVLLARHAGAETGDAANAAAGSSVVLTIDRQVHAHISCAYLGW